MLLQKIGVNSKPNMRSYKYREIAYIYINDI